MSAPNDTKSVVASPTVMLPPKLILPAMSASPVSFKLEPVISPEISLPTVATVSTRISAPNPVEPVTDNVPSMVWSPVTVTVPPVMLVTDAFEPVKDVIVTLEILFPSMLPVKSSL